MGQWPIVDSWQETREEDLAGPASGCRSLDLTSAAHFRPPTHLYCIWPTILFFISPFQGSIMTTCRHFRKNVSRVLAFWLSFSELASFFFPCLCPTEGQVQFSYHTCLCGQGILEHPIFDIFCLQAPQWMRSIFFSKILFKVWLQSCHTLFCQSALFPCEGFSWQIFHFEVTTSWLPLRFQLPI